MIGPFGRSLDSARIQKPSNCERGVGCPEDLAVDGPEWRAQPELERARGVVVLTRNQLARIIWLSIEDMETVAYAAMRERHLPARLAS